ncbi:MAG: Abi family protein [Clostridia bacterium]|nr:Abi family protein [Clostridia bacterium]
MKPAKTFEEQIEVLIKEHGLTISDTSSAIEALKRINYYHYRGYYIHWMDTQQQRFLPNITFEMIRSLQEFDHHLRMMIFSSLQKIELAVRCAIAYYIANEYGPMAHLDSNLYENKQYFDEFVAKVEESVSKSNELFITHHNNDYLCTPIWAAIEVVSFGTLSKMYRNLNLPIRKEIAKSFFGIDEELLVSYLHSFSFLRNACAHCGRLYNKKPSFFIKINKKYDAEIQRLRNKGFKVYPKSLFAYYLGMNDLLTAAEKEELADCLEALFTEYKDCININLMGFPLNWSEFR